MIPGLRAGNLVAIRPWASFRRLVECCRSDPGGLPGQLVMSSHHIVANLDGLVGLPDRSDTNQADRVRIWAEWHNFGDP